MVVLPTLSGLPALREKSGNAGGVEGARRFDELLAAASKDRAALVAPVRTGLSSEQASESLSRAWSSVFGEEPKPATVGILTAQWAHETGGGASMYNYNFGGIKGAGPGGFSVAQRTREGYGENERTIVDRFRAYGSADEGATDYVKLLAKRFPEAISAAKAGDPQAFVHGLKAHGYFTGSEQAYTRSIVALSGNAAGRAAFGGGAPAGETPRLDYSPMPSAPGADAPRFSPSFTGASRSAPFVDALAMADELSRTALSIAANPGRDRDSEST